MPVIAFHGDADPINKYDGGTRTATNWGYGIQAAATWPGSAFPLPVDQFGATDTSINSSELTWDFSSQYSLAQ